MKYFPLAVALLAISCVNNHEEVNTLSYVRDNRKGFCFAAYRLTSSSGHLINVPCTAEVERLIEDNVK